MPRDTANQHDRPEWYADGLRFECTMCGACCTGAPGFVGFSKAEGEAMAGRLGVSVQDFYSRYAHKMEHGRQGWSLNEIETEHGFDCVFLDRDTKPGQALCSIHEIRPQQCRTWPWWPENLRSRDAWRRTGKRCEGVDRGPLVRIQDIRIQRDATPT